MSTFCKASILFFLIVFGWCSGEPNEFCQSEAQYQEIPVVCKPAPFWQGSAVVNGIVKDLKLSDYAGKYLIFFFYPLDFTFVCPMEVLALNEKVGEFQDSDVEIVGVSVDSHFTHLAWINSLKKQQQLKDLKIPLLSDLTHKISCDYGVYMHDKGHSLRGLFVIDPKGILRHITLNDLPVSRSVEEILRIVKALQVADETGGSCPAGWQSGQSTIKETFISLVLPEPPVSVSAAYAESADIEKVEL